MGRKIEKLFEIIEIPEISSAQILTQIPASVNHQNLVRFFSEKTSVRKNQGY